jgi:hypothetical protein
MNKTPYRRLTLLCAVALAVTCASAAHAGPRLAGTHADARAARTIALKETATLRLTHNSVSTHEAEGQASGTLSGRLYLRIKVITASQMSVEFTGSHGSNMIAGSGVGHYTVSGSNLRFTGISKIVRGAGTYAHATGNDIRFEGTLNRIKSTLTTTISGQIST